MNVLCIKCVNIIVLKPFCVNFLHCSRQMTSCWWLSLWKRRSCRRWLRCLRKSWSCLPHLHAASPQKMAKKGKTMQVSRCVRPAAVVHSGISHFTAWFSSFTLSVSGGVTTAHQVPAVSQSAYSPPTPETPDSILSTPPQTILSKSMPHTFQTEQTMPTITGLLPTQPTAKVTVTLDFLYLYFWNVF